MRFKFRMGSVYAGPKRDVSMDDVYAGPEPDVSMDCVYAGPEKMGYEQKPEMGPVYAGPEPDVSMVGVYAGPEKMGYEQKPMMGFVYAGPDSANRAGLQVPGNINAGPVYPGPYPENAGLQDEMKKNVVPTNVAMKTVICKSCGEITPAKGKFCMNCGVKIETEGEVICPICGEKTREDMKFCNNCGAFRTTNKPEEDKRLPYPENRTRNV